MPGSRSVDVSERDTRTDGCLCSIAHRLSEAGLAALNVGSSLSNGTSLEANTVPSALTT